MGSFMCTNVSVDQIAHRKINIYKNPFTETAKARRHKHREREANRILFHKPRGRKEVETFHSKESHIVEHHDSQGNSIMIQIRHAKSLSSLTGLITPRQDNEQIPRIPTANLDNYHHHHHHNHLLETSTPQGESLSSPSISSENVNTETSSSNNVPVLSARDNVASIYEVTNDQEEEDKFKLKPINTSNSVDNFVCLDERKRSTDELFSNTKVRNIHRLRHKSKTLSSLIEKQQSKSYSEMEIRQILNDVESSSRSLAIVDEKRSLRILRHPSRTSIYSSQSRSSNSRAMELTSVSSETKV